MSGEVILEIHGLNKHFGPTHANKNIEFTLRRGEVHGLIGENGSGKSTLLSQIAGLYRRDSGEMRVNGEVYDPHSPLDANAHGISMVMQELGVVGNLPAGVNVFLGRTGQFAKGGVVKNFGVHGNGMGRGNGEALAIDENDPNNMFYGSRRSGLWKSTNNGSTWSHVDSWTTAAGSDTTWNGSGFSFVQYAPGSSKVMYAGFLREGTTAKGTFENVFTSTDGGASWKALPIPDKLRSTAGGSIVRLMPQRAVVSGDGKTMTVTFADGAGPHSMMMMWDEGWGMIYDGFGRGAVLQLDVSSATWSDVSPENFLDEGGDAKYDKVDVKGMVDCEAAGGTGKTCEEYYPYIAPYGGIAINPKNANEMVVTTEGYRGPQFWYTATSDTSGKWSDQWGTNIYHTTDGGKTWIASFKYYWMEGGVYPTTKQMDANGIGWMHNGSIHWSGSVAMDPFDNNRVFVGRTAAHHEPGVAFLGAWCRRNGAL